MNNRRTLLLIAILSLLVLAFHSTVKKRPGAKEVDEMADFMKRPGKWQGKYAPDFEAEQLDGRKFRLSDHIGKEVVILNFFATWCDPCNTEMPELVAYFEKHKNDHFTMIAINADEKREALRGFTEKHRVAFPGIIDRGGSLQKLYGVRSYPTTVLIGTDGIIHLYQIGPVANADVAFDTFFRQGQESVGSGKGIGKDAYLAALKAQEAKKEPEKEDKDEEKKPELTGRAKTISDKMDCPCGCSDKVAKCGCKTAKGIKTSLSKRDFSGKTDAQVIKELNKEFCVKDDNC